MEAQLAQIEGSCEPEPRVAAGDEDALQRCIDRFGRLVWSLARRFTNDLADAEDAGQETWSNLPRERKRFLKLLSKTKASGVVLISGDRHWSELSSLTEGVPYPLFDLTSSSFNQPHGRGTPTKNRYRASKTTYHKENFGAITIDWASDPKMTLEIRGTGGEVQLGKTLKLNELQLKSR